MTNDINDETNKFVLYNFFRSGTSHRLRIALNLKGLSYDYIPVNLRTEEHLSKKFMDLNPQGFVPVLVDKNHTLTQSPAIIEWLEETHPNPALLPSNSDDRAYVRAIASVVGCDIHPINNRRVLEYLKKEFSSDVKTINAWCTLWIESGFTAIESMLSSQHYQGMFCYKDTPTLADTYLIPQVESARRFGVDVSRYPKIYAIDQLCGKIEAFIDAAPSAQPDAVA
jgi:maleylpyruvate isomerase